MLKEGDRIKIISGVAAGKKGTITTLAGTRGEEGEEKKLWWVHLDGDRIEKLLFESNLELINET